MATTEPNAAPPRISLVTPSYNQGEYVEWTVRSVLLQRYPNLEYVVMDGGSTDATLERLAPYVDRFAYFQSQRDGGQSAAIAAGFARATGDIMGYINSDDMLLPGALAFVADYFDRHRDVDFVYGHRCIIDERNIVRGHWILPRHSSFLMRRWDLIPQESCFWRRSLFERCGNVDPAKHFAMDYDLFVRYMRQARFRRVDRFLAAFRIHVTSKTSVLLRTVGKEEIDAVQRDHRIRRYSQLTGDAFSLSVQLRSAMFVRRGAARPGLPPGIGYDLDDVWGNQLSRRGA
jgi:glycosyltransferase involved in cell wall biosynthesis